MTAILVVRGRAAHDQCGGNISNDGDSCQYTAEVCQAHLAAHSTTCSMSRAGVCLDDALAERFFVTLKAKLVGTCPTRQG